MMQNMNKPSQKDNKKEAKARTARFDVVSIKGKENSYNYYYYYHVRASVKLKVRFCFIQTYLAYFVQFWKSHHTTIPPSEESFLKLTLLGVWSVMRKLMRRCSQLCPTRVAWKTLARRVVLLPGNEDESPAPLLELLLVLSISALLETFFTDAQLIETKQSLSTAARVLAMLINRRKFCWLLTLWSSVRLVRVHLGLLFFLGNFLVNLINRVHGLYLLSLDPTYK